MSKGKQAAIVGFSALALALMIFSYYRAFHSGPPTPPPEAGRKMEAAMKKLIEDTQARERERGRADRSAGPSAAKGQASKE